MTTVCACMWLGLFPLLQGGTYAHITYDKWVIMLALAGVSAAGLLAGFIFRRRNADLLKPKEWILRVPVLAAAALALWILVSCLASPFSPEQWVVGASVRREGLVAQLCYLGLFFLFSSSRVRRVPVMLSTAAGLVLFFVVVILQRAGVNALGLYPEGRSFETTPDFQGTIGNIDMGTGYLCLAAGLLAGEITSGIPGLFRSFRLLLSSGGEAAQTKKRKAKQALLQARKKSAGRLAYSAFLLAALGLAVFLILTMDTEAGKFVLAFLVLISLLQWLPRRWKLPVFLVLLAVVLAVVWVWPAQLGGIFELHEALHGRAKLSFGNDRIAVWIYSLAMARDRLWTGTGSDTFEPVFKQYMRDIAPLGLKVPAYRDELFPLPASFGEYLETNHLVFLKPFFREYLEKGAEAAPAVPDRTPLPSYFDNPHNEYIAHLANHGLPAMLLFVALILSAVFFRRKKRTGAAPSGSPEKRLPENRFRPLSPWAVAVLCYAVQAVFAFSVCIVAPMFWVVLGICVRNGPAAESAV